MIVHINRRAPTRVLIPDSISVSPTNPTPGNHPRLADPSQFPTYPGPSEVNDVNNQSQSSEIIGQNRKLCNASKKRVWRSKKKTEVKILHQQTDLGTTVNQLTNPVFIVVSIIFWRWDSQMVMLKRGRICSRYYLLVLFEWGCVFGRPVIVSRTWVVGVKPSSGDSELTVDSMCSVSYYRCFRRKQSRSKVIIPSFRCQEIRLLSFGGFEDGCWLLVFMDCLDVRLGR